MIFLQQFLFRFVCLFIFVRINKLYKQVYDNILYSPLVELINI